MVIVTTTNVNAQTVYASLSSGNWNDAATWETYSTFANALSATPGSGTAAANAPSGTHNVVIRNGHTIAMNGANRGCKGIIINAGGKLWANETADRRLQIGSGGTGFSYPLVDTVQIDGILGGAGDGCFIEIGVSAQLVKISGSGTVEISRFTVPGGIGSAAGGALAIDVDININLWKSANYAMSIVYNPALTDNYTLNIKPGRTVTIKSPDGYFHNSQNTATYGRYVYNIQGTLDLSANTQTTNNLSTTMIAPSGANSAVVVNVDGGTFKAGSGIKMDTSNLGPISNGILDFNVINNGVVDLTATTNLRVGKTADGLGGFYDMFFGLDGTGSVKQNITSDDFKFPIGVFTSTSQNYCRIANSGTADVHTVKVKSTFDQAPTDPTKVVNRQWTISELTSGGSVDTIRLSWLTSDQASAFDPAATIYVMRWNGTAWEYLSASISGSGTIDDPYQAKAAATSSLGIFGVSNLVPLPVKLLSFKGTLSQGKANLNWTITEQQNVTAFLIEESFDGMRFNQIGRVEKTTDNVVNQYAFTGANVISGQAYYRIKIMERDGAFLYSNIVVLKNNSKNKLTVANTIINTNQVNLLVNELPAGIYQIAFLNPAGQLIQKTEINHKGGAFNENINFNKLISGGVYFVNMNGNGFAQTAQILIK